MIGFVILLLPALVSGSAPSEAALTVTQVNTVWIQPSSGVEAFENTSSTAPPPDLSTSATYPIGSSTSSIPTNIIQQSDLIAVATSTVSPPEVTGKSAPIAGQDASPSCRQIWANNPKEDWLFSTLCSWANADPNWALSALDYADQLNFTDKNDLPAINVTLYDGSLNIRPPRTMAFEGVKSDGNSNANDAWWRGAIRNALLDIGDPKITSDNAFKEDQGSRDWAGYQALVSLIGMHPTREDPSQLNDVIWEMWLDKSSYTPITILTRPNSSCVASERYFSVVEFNKTISDDIKLWDPSAGGEEGYFSVNAGKLKPDVQWLFHLDWQRYYPVARRSYSDLNSYQVELQNE